MFVVRIPNFQCVFGHRNPKKNFENFFEKCCFSAKNGQISKKFAAWGAKNLTKNLTKMAENWSFFDKKLAFFFSEPFGTYFVPKKILGVTWPILADFSAKRRRLRPNFYPKAVSKGFPSVKWSKIFKNFIGLKCIIKCSSCELLVRI